MKEEHLQQVLQLIRGDRSVGIPNARLEGVFVGELLALVDHLAPRHFLFVGTREIVDGNLLGLGLRLGLHIGDCNQTVNCKVHWNDL